MNRLANALCGVFALALLLAAFPASAQFTDVTIRQLNTLPQENIDALNALGPNATISDISAQLTNEWVNQNVRVQAVVLTDPRYSGLASWNSETGRPGRVHLFIRDLAAETEGPEGMTIQIVDNSDVGFNLRPGDIIEVEGRLTVFSPGVWQLSPADAFSIQVEGTMEPTGPLFEPVVVTTDDLNMVVAEQGGESIVRVNWDNWNSLMGQYVRFEGATITNSLAAPTGRPNWAWSSAGTGARVASDDISLRYRNDRAGVYQPPYFVRPADDPFTPPPPGAVVDVQGFVLFRGNFDQFNIGSPPNGFLIVSPFTDDDLVLSSSPPVIAVPGISAVPTGPFAVTADVTAAGGSTVASVELNYSSSNGQSGSVPMTASGDNLWTATVPAAAATDGAFVTFSVTATDSEGLTNTSASTTTRVLFGGITSIEHIQRTANDGAGASPFAGLTTDMDLEVVVQTNPQVANFISVQDGTDPWSGIVIANNEAVLSGLNEGDRVRITRAQIQARAFQTPQRLVVSPADFEVIGSTEPYGYVTGLPTGLFTDADFAGQYEGMMVRFDDVVITSENPDAPNNDFGEWAFSSDGTAQNQLRGDSESPVIMGGSEMFAVGDELDFIRGLLVFTFNNYKIWPETMGDIAFASSTEDGAAYGTTAFVGSYPNPTAGSATLRYTLAADTEVRLDVFDVTGRRVVTLVDGFQAAGEQQATLDASGLASGVYLVRLSAGSTVQSTRLVVAR